MGRGGGGFGPNQKGLLVSCDVNRTRECTREIYQMLNTVRRIRCGALPLAL